MEAPDFWNDAEVSQQKMKELKSYKDDVAVCAQLEEKLSDIETLIAMGDEENDVSLIPEIEEEIKEYEEAFEKIRIKTLLSGEYDKDNAIVSLHAGAGGTESAAYRRRDAEDCARRGWAWHHALPDYRRGTAGKKRVRGAGAENKSSAGHRIRWDHDEWRTPGIVCEGSEGGRL